jgi:glycosyltransferase involved in cell wall biosynthesis
LATSQTICGDLERGSVLCILVAEGFGLVLEAMACGTPVLTSNVSAIPEVVGSAARLVDPESVAELEAAIAELCDDSERRAQWRELGLARSRMFNWDRTASQTLEILRGAATGGTR